MEFRLLAMKELPPHQCITNLVLLFREKIHEEQQQKNPPHLKNGPQMAGEVGKLEKDQKREDSSVQMMLSQRKALV